MNTPLAQFAAVAFVALAGLACTPVSRADYAVMRSGARIHITGYEQVGDHVRLTVPGGSVDVAPIDLVSVEPEDQFAALPAAAEATGPYGPLIRASAAKHGVDERLITHVISVESNFNPRAVSPKRAQGLMQLLPTTAAKYSVANVFDPAQNIEGGTRYLKDLLAKYSGNIALTLAAYNAGPEMVTRYKGVPPFPETQKYVRTITAKLALEAAPSLKN